MYVTIGFDDFHSAKWTQAINKVIWDGLQLCCIYN